MDKQELKKIYQAKKEKKGKSSDGEIITSQQGFKSTTWEQFEAWFKQEEFDKGCHYCGTKNEESLRLYNLRPHATRGGKRGKRLEIDRREPARDYDETDNLVWACYWCNNAKSNFFSEEEFKPIAFVIGEVLNSIINKSNKKS